MAWDIKWLWRRYDGARNIACGDGLAGCNDFEIRPPHVSGWKFEYNIAGGKLAVVAVEQSCLGKPALIDLAQIVSCAVLEIRMVLGLTSGSSIGPPQMAQYAVNSLTKVICMVRGSTVTNFSPYVITEFRLGY